jgi:hypothetical protein
MIAEGIICRPQRGRVSGGRGGAICRPQRGRVLATKGPRAYNKCRAFSRVVRGSLDVSDLDVILFRNSDRLIANRMR